MRTRLARSRRGHARRSRGRGRERSPEARPRAPDRDGRIVRVVSAAADEEEGAGGKRGRPRGLKKRGVAAAVSEISGRKKKEHP
jgi:hypothetical protein